MKFKVDDLVEVVDGSIYSFRKIGEIYKIINIEGEYLNYTRVKNVLGTSGDAFGGCYLPTFSQIFKLYNEQEEEII